MDRALIERVKADLPELPVAMKARFEKEYLFFPEDATALTSTRATADYFQQTLAELAGIPNIPYLLQSPDVANAKSVANWVINELGAFLNNHQTDIENSPVSPAQLAQLIAHTGPFKGTISHKVAKDVLAAMWAGECGGDADAIIVARGLKQISDAGAIGKIVDDVIAANAPIVAEYKAGKEKAFNALVGKVMAATKGKANPSQVNAILKQKLGA